MALRMSLSLACVVLMGVSSVVVAQPPEGRGRRGMGREMLPLMLLDQKSVQDELKLSEQQIADANKAAEGQRGAFRSIFSASEADRPGIIQKLRTDSEEATAKILTPDQLKRLGQIRLQVRGAGVFTSEETAKALGLTDDQKQQVAKIDEELSNERSALFENRDGDREEARKKWLDLSKSAKEKAEAVLTADQKTKWAEMIGEPFTGEITFGGRGGRGPRPDGAGGGDRPARPASE